MSRTRCPLALLAPRLGPGRGMNPCPDPGIHVSTARSLRPPPARALVGAPAHLLDRDPAVARAGTPRDLHPVARRLRPALPCGPFSPSAPACSRSREATREILGGGSRAEIYCGGSSQRSTTTAPSFRGRVRRSPKKSRTRRQSRQSSSQWTQGSTKISSSSRR